MERAENPRSKGSKVHEREINVRKKNDLWDIKVHIQIITIKIQADTTYV